MHIETNDPSQPSLSLSVTGFVEKFAEINPERVRMVGPAGSLLFAEVRIVPRKEYPFTVGEVTVKNGTHIKYSVIRRCTDDDKRCVIRLENTRVEKGGYADVLYVSTDSSLRPTIPIYITGMIQ